MKTVELDKARRDENEIDAAKIVEYIVYRLLVGYRIQALRMSSKGPR